MKYVVTLLACALSILAAAQTTELKGEVKFKVQAPAKEIVANATGFTVKLDRKKGTATFTVPVRSFRFNNNFRTDTLNNRLKARFNDYYMESERYPLITFNGYVPGLNLDKDGRYRQQGKATLTVHGISKEIDFNCDIEVHARQVTILATAVFVPAYFSIRIPPYINDFYFRTVEVELLAEN